MSFLEPPKDLARIARDGKIAILILIAILLGLGIYSNVRENSLKHNKAFGNAIVYEIVTGGKSGPLARFGFVYDGKVYKSTYSIPELKFKTDKNKLLGKWFPVVYDTINPDNNRLIMTMSDFQNYQLKFPDSLNWVQSIVY